MNEALATYLGGECQGVPQMWGMACSIGALMALQDHWANKVALVNHDKLTELAPNEKQITYPFQRQWSQGVPRQNLLHYGLYGGCHLFFMTPTWTLRNRAGAAPWPV